MTSTYLSQLPQSGRLFPVCCAAEIPPSTVDRYLIAIFEYKDIEAVYSVLIDDLSEKYTTECDVDSPRTTSTKAPFKGKDLRECSSVLQQMCRDGSDIDYSCFVIMDERTLHDDTVLIAVSDWQNGQEETRSIRSTFEVVEGRLGGYGVVPEEFERDLATAAEAEDGVLRAHAIEARMRGLRRERPHLPPPSLDTPPQPKQSTVSQSDRRSAVFKVVLIGDPKVGKTTYVQHHMTGQFDGEYTTQPGVQINHIQFHTNMGLVQFDIWDVAGQEKFQSQRDSYYADANCGIIMFDLTSRITYNNAQGWHRDLLRVCQDLPIVLVGSKSDKPAAYHRDGNIKSKRLKYHHPMELQYYDLSVKSNQNTEMPFLWLARELVGDQSLEFVAEPAPTPPEMSLDQVAITRYLREAEDASNVPLLYENYGGL